MLKEWTDRDPHAPRGPAPNKRWQWLWVPVTLAGLIAFGWLSFR